jgi:metallo-beta-lactamase family protein
VRTADWLVLESTYGDRVHPALADWEAALTDVVRRTAARGGVVVIPAFAVGRAQTVLWMLHRLRERGEIPALPIYVDSPMAADALTILRAHGKEHRLTPAETRAMIEHVRVTHTPDQSKAIDDRNGPMIVISASGMATGGRVLFHLERFAPDHRNAVLIVGHQAAGTRGDALVRGERVLKIHGHHVPVRAEVAVLDGLSAHADASEILAWLKGFERPPRETFVTHGEPIASDALRHHIEEELGWTVRVPEHGEVVTLGREEETGGEAPRLERRGSPRVFPTSRS